MEKYKANKNSQNDEEVQERPKTQDEKNVENNVNTINNAAEVAIASKNPYAMAAGYAVKGLDKLTGGKSTQALGKAMNRANKSAPGGQAVQNMSNQLAESGVGDKIGQAASMKNSMGGGGAGGKAASGGKPASGGSKTTGGSNSSSASSNGSSSSSSVFSSDSGMFTNNIMSFKMSGSMKIKIIIVVSAAFLLMMLIMAAVGQKDNQNLAVTNHTVFSQSTAGGTACTSEEVEGKTVYVGDRAVENISTSLGSSESEFVINSGGYDNFKNVILPNLKTKLNGMDDGVIVLSFDIYDLANFDLYVNDYLALILEFSKVKFYVMSFGPVDDSLATSLGITNALVEEYNQKIIDKFNDRYIDIYNKFKGDYTTVDGVTYDAETNKEIHNYVMESVSTSGLVVCSGGSIESIVATQLLGSDKSVLSGSETILSKIGQTELDEWNMALSNDVINAGKGNGLAPAIAAFGLIQGALSRGFVLPYVPGGSSSNGKIQGDWGVSTGLDSFGFINWAAQAGGCSTFVNKTANDIKSMGKELDPFDSVPGDIIVSDTDAKMVIYNDGFSLITAESNVDYGLVFSEYYYSQVKKYSVISMSNYYKTNCY